MLQITNSASEFLQEARTVQGIPETYGVRVFAESGIDGQTAIHVGFAEGPVAGDEVVESEGTAVYVASEVSDALAEFVMDTAATDEGPNLVLKRQ